MISLPEEYEGHTPADQWTTYKMGADNPYHAVRIGGEGFDLPITKGADARLIAAAPELLVKAKVLDKIIAWHDKMQLQSEGIEYELDRMNWMLENPDKDYDDYPYTYDGGFREGFEEYDAESTCSCGCNIGDCQCKKGCGCGCNHAKGGAKWAAEEFGAEGGDIFLKTFIEETTSRRDGKKKVKNMDFGLFFKL